MSLGIRISHRPRTVRAEPNSRGGEKGEIVETAPQRSFTPNEFRALVRASGRFEIARELGAMDLAVSFTNEKAAWRMVPVLRKKE